jgi:hypothetical protein
MPGTFGFLGLDLTGMTYGELFLIALGVELIVAFGVTVAAHFTSGVVRVAIIALAVLQCVFLLGYILLLAAVPTGLRMPA